MSNTRTYTQENSTVDLLSSLGIELIGGRFKIISEIGNSYGGASFVGSDIENDDARVFIKSLICPRGDYEKSKFLSERDALNQLTASIVKISAQLLHFERHERLPIYFIVTEWVEGTSVRQLLDCCGTWLPREGIEVLLRISAGLAYGTMLHQHRDIHPENIVLLPRDKIEDGSDPWPNNLYDPAIRILDWGESIPVMLGSYEIHEEHLRTLHYQVPRRLSGSFYSLPPESFWQPWRIENSIGGKHESWALGLLIYKVLKNQDLIIYRSIGDYCHSLQSGQLGTSINKGAEDLSAMALPGRALIPLLLRGLLAIDPQERFSPNIAMKTFKDIIFNSLTLDFAEAAKYLLDPSSYGKDDADAPFNLDGDY